MGKKVVIYILLDPPMDPPTLLALQAQLVRGLQHTRVGAQEDSIHHIIVIVTIVQQLGISHLHGVQKGPIEAVKAPEVHVELEEGELSVGGVGIWPIVKWPNDNNRTVTRMKTPKTGQSVECMEHR